MGFADLRVKFDRGEEALGVFRVVGENLGAELDLATGLADALAHLQRHDAGELVGPGVEQCGGLVQDERAVGVRGMAPGFIAMGRLRQFGFELRGGEGGKGFADFAVEGIDALVGRSGLGLFGREGGVGEGGSSPELDPDGSGAE